jgi:Fe-S-cluster containining protein
MSEIESTTNPCETCSAVCCGPRVIVEFSKTEVSFLRSAGTQMLLLTDYPEKTFIEGNEYYSLESRCGFVDRATGKCNVFDDPQRPAVCGLFKAGSPRCLELQARPKPGYQFGY